MNAGRSIQGQRQRALVLTHSTPGSRRFMFTSPLLLTLSKFDSGYKKVVLGDGAHTVGSHSR